MGVPMLGRLKGLRAAVSDGDPLLLDGSTGGLFVRPPANIVRSFDEQVALKTRRQKTYARLKDLPATTKDGTRVALMMNAGLRSDLAALGITGADGIGLFRTEFQFLVSATLPRRQAQVALYRDVLAAAGERPVVFRTVDIGGDKAVPYLGSNEDENPAMGWRALRLALERDGLMVAQARALLEACAGRTLHVMFPMVSEPWEFAAAKALVERSRVRLAKLGRPHATAVRYGAMLEVPALAEVLDELLPMVDFVSIGTNDLTQFLLAADRGNPKLADRYDWLARGVLRFLARVAAAAREAGTPLAVCGEMGGRPLEALALLGLGIERFSITPAAIGPVKAMVRSVDLAALRPLMRSWLAEPGADIRKRLRDWAAKELVDLG
jgi:phosphotransferase system enzyme I (PtsP)